MAITEWPECERPRERLLKQGAAALSDAFRFVLDSGGGVGSGDPGGLPFAILIVWAVGAVTLTARTFRWE